MDRYSEIIDLIKSKTAKVAIIGLGYIGLPTALFYAKQGLRVYGVDTNKDLIDDLRGGNLWMKEEGLGELAEAYLEGMDIGASYEIVADADICVLCLPSPIDDENKPVIAYLESSVKDLAEHLKKNTLVIVESTVPVGTTEHLAGLFKEHRKGELNKDVWFVHSPERVMPGQIVREMSSNSRLVGGVTEDATELGRLFLGTVFGDELVFPTTSRVSETSKLAENAYRDASIAYANELAKICTALSVDVSEVIKFSNMHPRVDILNPGLGVGGYCFPKDGWILVDSAKKKGFDASLIPTARRTNDSMPEHVFKRMKEEVPDLKESDTVVGIIGLSYKPNVSDTRQSPSIAFLKILSAQNITTIVYDPFVKDNFGAERTDSVDDLIKQSNIVLLGTGHDEVLKSIDPEKLVDKVFVDPWNLMPSLRGKVRKYIGLTV